MRVREDFTELFCSGLKSGNILLWYQCFNVWWRELVPYQKSARITIPVRSTMPTCPSKILPSKLQDRRLPFVYAIDLVSNKISYLVLEVISAPNSVPYSQSIKQACYICLPFILAPQRQAQLLQAVLLYGLNCVSATRGIFSLFRYDGRCLLDKYGSLKTRKSGWKGKGEGEHTR